MIFDPRIISINNHMLRDTHEGHLVVRPSVRSELSSFTPGCNIEYSIRLPVMKWHLTVSVGLAGYTLVDILRISGRLPKTSRLTIFPHLASQGQITRVGF
jgi:hypothetical protein